ncbi:hypothetical protein [Fischerella sp. JS2]|uniref:hypothetical protein n=1 Tax=Fischerella sp. JS2 TaxID=2597771 RepID=UPI0028E660FA|nr:hypothetical protein [Fischerella sp. JS2]
MKGSKDIEFLANFNAGSSFYRVVNEFDLTGDRTFTLHHHNQNTHRGFQLPVRFGMNCKT